ncbi:MAG: sugar kinase, partial [Mesorhizobium sp.]
MGGHLTLGIDIGTTNVKAAVLDTNTGKVVASGSQEHPLFHPFPGWAEQDASNYWGAVVSSVRQCLEQGRFADDIVAVALSGLVGVTLPVSDQGRPLRQAMIWMDSRSEEECEDIRRSVGEATINRNNGNRIAPWFIDPKA